MSTAIWRTALPTALVFLTLTGTPARLAAQAEYRVYTNHPRLFLDEGRLKRVTRDVERQTPRWNRLAALLENPAAPAEPGFALALAYKASGEPVYGKAALGWARSHASEGFAEAGSLRQAALAFDWCYDLLDEEGKSELVAAMSEAASTAAQLSGRDLSGVRDGLFAAIALAGDWPGSETVIGAFLGRQWPEDVLPLLEAGQLGDRNDELIALLEISHAVGPNLDKDLWEDSPQAFRSLPLTRILAASGRKLETAEGAVREPWLASPLAGDALEREAVLARVADLLLVGYDGAQREFQFLQGWLRNDSFTLTGPFGTPYEFLWLNPYLPGLTPTSGPRIAFDPVRGRLFARESWDDGAPRLFAAGGRTTIDAGSGPREINAASQQEPIEFAGATVIFPEVPGKLKAQVQPAPHQAIPDLYFIGLAPGRNYEIRVGKSDWLEFQAGPGGILRVRSDPREHLIDDLDFSTELRIQIRDGKPVSSGPAPTLGPAR